ncbi:hypothetical protein B0T22DRAFT_70589 [Podospora appendiculata]|uniref:Uncharacterized protein n=1 Tax=Podospora appendiculata TaxID=314037 RepID=A0AAE0XJ57_9PEZI|nr:hypothetical protein B0T22DRAFT_70589 [Podospora appendiculata]
MPSLPLKVQVGIRDHWNREDGALQTILKSVQELLGRDVSIEPEWQLLTAELDTFYPDKGNLVAIVAGCVQVWAKSMMELLDDESLEKWTELVLEKTLAPGRLRVFLEVGTSDKAATSWSERRGGFVVSLPKRQVFQPAELFPVFRSGLLACFDEEKKAEIPVRSADDWADVEMDTATGKAQVVEQSSVSPSSSGAKVEFFPSVGSLPRPDQLFLKPPYHLTMTLGSEIEIQCSHSPTLQFLSDYLRRWCRVNHHDTTNPPAIQVTLHQSAFGLSEMFDRLVLSTEDTRYTNQFKVTSPVLIALIEGVLGYELVSSHGAWSFRRDAEYKSL